VLFYANTPLRTKVKIMAVGRKTIPNDMRGTPKASQGRHHAHQAARPETAGKPAHDSRQTNKILELEWEALGKKLNKPVVKENVDVEKLRSQLKDKEEQLKYAESLIDRLKKQVQALEQRQKPQNQGQQKAQMPKKNPHNPQKQFQRPPQRKAPTTGRK
jgi:chromosome segregation ATPase